MPKNTPMRAPASAPPMRPQAAEAPSSLAERCLLSLSFGFVEEDTERMSLKRKERSTRSQWARAEVFAQGVDQETRPTDLRGRRRVGAGSSLPVTRARFTRGDIHRVEPDD